ncbi:MAG TPA: hypothetical protein VHF47_13720, partial [Acidimicrobiales bacterium]|nr:hypothetical protein [Acidimicrobiales bacterium]
MKAHRAALALAVVTASLGLSAPGAADDTPVEDSCTLHPTHVVNPGCVPAVTSELQQPGRSYPDISPDVQDVLLQRPFVQDPETQMFVPGRMHIWFDTWAQNLGTVPVQLTVEEIQSTSSSTVTQCVAWTLRVCRERAEVGGFSWHEEHRHFHYDDFAAYQLRRLAADGRPDYSDAGLIAISDKVSYCMVDSFLLDPTKPSPPTYVGCSNVQQGISPG